MDDVQRRSVEVLELVRVMQTLERLTDNVEEHGERQTSLGRGAPQDSLERLPFEVLHRDEVMLAVVPHLIRLNDVRVVDAR